MAVMKYQGIIFKSTGGPQGRLPMKASVFVAVHTCSQNGNGDWYNLYTVGRRYFVAAFTCSAIEEFISSGFLTVVQPSRLTKTEEDHTGQVYNPYTDEWVWL